MPNLTIKAPHNIAIALEPILGEIEALLIRQMKVPKSNVMLIECAVGPTTAKIYAELVYMKGESRPPEFIRDIGKALYELMQPAFEGDFAFRGFPMLPSQLVPVNISDGTDA